MAAPVIHIGDATIQTTVEQKTYPSLHIMDHTGAVYHVAVRAQDEQLATGTETLVYEQTAINTCETVTLDAGLYRAELRGGSGGLPSKCNNPVDKTPMLGYINTSIFKLDASTTISVFRGGDGNNSGTVASSQLPGGGASGVDSLVVLPTRTIRATGGVGVRCTKDNTNNPAGGGQAYEAYCTGGGAGTNGFVGWGAAETVICAGGGGGAPNGTGGAAAKNTTAGADATSTGGGNGGDATNPNGDSKTSNVGHGGAGGANVAFQCGGATAIGYGGGGAGGLCYFVYAPACTKLNSWCVADCVDGGDGGSGSTGTSTDSYVKIYKIG